MNYKNIKKGDRVLIPGKVLREPDGDYLYVTFQCGVNRNGFEYFRHADVSKYLIFPPENGTKNTESAPKYDPCRKFRKGDKVRVFAYKGRTPKNHPTDEGYVLKDENDYNTVIVNFGENGRWQINVAYLELVTPVEEMEPYSVTIDDGGHYVCDKEGMVLSLYYNNIHPNAKAAAEAECARLNEEHRKEQQQ